MADLRHFSPSDPDIQALIQSHDPDVERLADWMDIVDSWERLSPIQQRYVALDAAWLRGGIMRQFIIVAGATILAAAAVYLASKSWEWALLVGVVIGYIAGQLTRKRRKQ